MDLQQPHTMYTDTHLHNNHNNNLASPEFLESEFPRSSLYMSFSDAMKSVKDYNRRTGVNFVTARTHNNNFFKPPMVARVNIKCNRSFVLNSSGKKLAAQETNTNTNNKNSNSNNSKNLGGRPVVEKTGCEASFTITLTQAEKDVPIDPLNIDTYYYKFNSLNLVHNHPIIIPGPSTAPLPPVYTNKKPKWAINNNNNNNSKSEELEERELRIADSNNIIMHENKSQNSNSCNNNNNYNYNNNSNINKRKRTEFESEEDNNDSTVSSHSNNSMEDLIRFSPIKRNKIEIITPPPPPPPPPQETPPTTFEVRLLSETTPIKTEMETEPHPPVNIPHLKGVASALIAASVHDNKPLAPVVCLRYKYTGYCKLKSNCPYSHSEGFFVKPINYSIPEQQQNIDTNTTINNTTAASTNETPSNIPILPTPPQTPVSSAPNYNILTPQHLQYANRNLPSGYICKRCGGQHFIQLCPLGLSLAQQTALTQYQSQQHQHTQLQTAPHITATPNNNNNTNTNNLMPIIPPFLAPKTPSSSNIAIPAVPPIPDIVSSAPPPLSLASLQWQVSNMNNMMHSMMQAIHSINTRLAHTATATDTDSSNISNTAMQQ